MKLRKKFAALALLAVLPLSSAKAADLGHMAGFYLAIKGIQVTALSGTADFWNALGYAQKAQDTMGIAQGLQAGNLGPDVAQNAMKVASIEVQAQIEELEAVGAPLTKEQRAAARAAYLKIAGTTVLWVAAVVEGKKALDSVDNGLAKVIIGIAMVAEAAEAGKATGALLSAWRSYSNFNSGLRGLKPPSKELFENSPTLAAL